MNRKSDPWWVGERANTRVLTSATGALCGGWCDGLMPHRLAGNMTQAVELQ
jgi:hypothetical protein